MHSLKRRLNIDFTISFAICAILLCAIIGIYSGSTFIDIQNKMAKEIAVSESKYFSEWLQGNVKETALIAQSDEVRSGDINQIKQYLTNTAKNRKDIVSISFIDDKGNGWSTYYFDKYNVLDRDYFKQLMVKKQGMYYISNPLMSKSAKKPVVVISYVIINKEGQRVGIINSNILLKHLSNVVSNIKIGSSYAWIVDGLGTIAAYPDSKYLLNYNVNTSAFPDIVGMKAVGEEMQKNKSGISKITYKGNYMTVVYTPIDKTLNWKLVISINNSEFTKNFNMFLYIIMAMLVAIIIIMYFLINIVSMHITKPIKLLAYDTRMIALGNFNYNLDINYKNDDEIKMLIRNFVTMKVGINNLLMKLKESNEKLEKEKKLLIKSEEHIQYLAYYDVLTDLPNKNEFIDKLRKAILRSEGRKQIAVIIIDLDNFNLINDTFGHNYGDDIIINVSQRLKNKIGNKCFLSRSIGDEFLIFCEDIESNECVIALAEEIMSIFKERFILKSNEILLTASLGISIYPKDSSTAEALIKNADIAINNVKNDSRNNYCFFNDSQEQLIKNKLNLFNNLEIAMQNNEFEVFYQPQISSENYEITGFEALIRWKHPKDGYIQPIKFIPFAEESGFIVKLGEWILKTACEQCKDWQLRYKKDITIAVNISVKQITEGFIQTITSVLEKTKLEPRFLEIEITESILMANFDHNIKIINKLREIGVKFSLDDFGTGYSSLNYLRKLPIEVLKIDKSFIDEMLINNETKCIIETILILAHSLNMEVISEGVESKEQVQYLQEICCEKIQGYYFSKPKPSKEIEEMLQQNKKIMN